MSGTITIKGLSSKIGEGRAVWVGYSDQTPDGPSVCLQFTRPGTILDRGPTVICKDVVVDGALCIRSSVCLSPDAALALVRLLTVQLSDLANQQTCIADAEPLGLSLTGDGE